MKNGWEDEDSQWAVSIIDSLHYQMALRIQDPLADPILLK
jgi:hypothetical protein